MRKTDKRPLEQTAATDVDQQGQHEGVIQSYMRPIFRWPLIIGLLVYALITCYGCASSGLRARETEAHPAQVANWAPCTPEIRQANCDWRGSYQHVRAQHCENDCTASNESQYRAGFIDTCNDHRLAEVCFTTVQDNSCQYYPYLGGYVVSSNLPVIVGSDRNQQCSNSTVTTVVLDQYMRVITMYPGH